MPQLLERREMLGRITSSSVEIKPQQTFSCKTQTAVLATPTKRVCLKMFAKLDFKLKNKQTNNLFWTVLRVSRILLLHERSSQTYHLGQENGVRVHVGPKTVEHFEDGGIEVQQGGARLEQEGGGGRGGGWGAPSTSRCPRRVTRQNESEKAVRLLVPVTFENYMGRIC